MPATEITPPVGKTPDTTVLAPRLMSLDALRGFDMFWILGADSLVYALQPMKKNPVTSLLAEQLDHVDWQGFHFYDLIFPLFVFMAGVAAVFSLGRLIDQSGRGAAVARVLRRSVLLFIVALFYSGGFSSPWPDIRLLGVLNRIALAYGAAGLAFCFLYRRPAALAGLCAALLAGYWALMTFVPFPDVRPVPGGDTIIAKENGFTNSAQLNFASTNYLRGVFLKGVNLANYLDQKYLPGKRWDGTWDPEGLLSTIPAVGSCLLGVLAGLLMVTPRVKPGAKVAWLLGAGAVAVGLGFLWGLQFPVIKKIWTSSYVLVAGGYSAMLLGAFYLVVDVLGFRLWCQPLVWVGMNPITLYLTKNIIGGYTKLAARFAGGDVKSWFDAHISQGAGELVISLVGLGLMFWLARFLYRRKIFLRL